MEWWIRAITPAELPVGEHIRIKNLALPSLVSALEGFIAGDPPRYAEGAYPYFGLVPHEDA